MIKKIFDFFGIDTDPSIGLEISSTAIKMMLLSKNANNQIVLENYVFEALEPGIVVEKNIINRERVIAAIKDAYKKMNVATKKVCISIPSSTSITRNIKMSADLSDKEIGSEIELEAERYIPYPLDEINLDYTIIGPVDDDPDQVDVVLAVSKIDNVDMILDIISEAGLVAGIVDIDSFALQRAFDPMVKKLSTQGKRKIVAIFDIGATVTTLNIFEHNKIIYNREQAFGGQHLVDEVENVYGLTYEEAINAIKYNDLPEEYYKEILEPFKQTIAQQISRFCQYFFSSGDYNAIDYLFLTGGGSNVSGLDSLVQSKLQIKTLVANPCSEFLLAPHIKNDSFQMDVHRMMICTGLALRNVQENDKH